MSLGEIEFSCVCHSVSAVGNRIWRIYILHDNHACARVFVCVCVPRGHTEAYVNLCFTKTLRAAYDPNAPTPPSNTHLNPDAVRHRRHASPL